MARKVLIADDSPTIQKRAGGILTGEGYEVVTVSNGVAAVKKLPAVMPLVVLADVAMPGKDGYEVCEFVKNDGALKHVPVLLVFSDTDPIEEHKAMQAQADGRISKPFHPQELVSVVGKFAAMAEAAAAQPVAPPPPVYVTEPVDAEPEPEQKHAIPDMSAFSGGIAIGDIGVEEHFAPSPAPFEPFVEPAPEMPQPEIAASKSPLAPPEPPPVWAEPVLVEEAEPMPPLPPAEDEPLAAERTMHFHAPSEIAEPILSEEATGAPAPPELAAPSDELDISGLVEEAAGAPAPPELAAPSDELDISALVEEAAGAPASPELAAPPAEPEIPPVSAAALESFSRQNRESGQERFAAAEEFPVEDTEPRRGVAGESAVQQADRHERSRMVAPPPAAPKTLDAEQVFAIVHRVVVNMSPPALSPQVVEDIARRFANELIQELESRP